MDDNNKDMDIQGAGFDSIPVPDQNSKQGREGATGKLEDIVSALLDNPDDTATGGGDSSEDQRPRK
ncbi:hypothetical protein GCM10010912_41430 [Paenibacillus albidus]|uniref:Uncharacterized protein n=1 Tax=Paenibacillus albidus TaxID=2041023 RepID=A0A917FNT0_9BACL|nr:hypothetical protein [Paenibacillus albidus]GGF92195.1 hypothetical protein GCM10010912_41430 [Paenibacillus albidus]